VKADVRLPVEKKKRTGKSGHREPIHDSGAREYQKAILLPEERKEEYIPNMMAAAKKGHPRAAIVIADKILTAPRSCDYHQFGASPPIAAKNLLLEAAKAEPAALLPLGNLLLDGSEDVRNVDLAKQIFSRAAKHNLTSAWPKLAGILLAENTLQSRKEAYYWLIKATRTVSPDSFGGEALWRSVKDCSREMTNEDIISTWRRLDEEVQTHFEPLDPPPFNEGAQPEEQVVEARRRAKEMEDLHRAEIRSRQQ
jgi:hypothetical protein